MSTVRTGQWRERWLPKLFWVLVPGWGLLVYADLYWLHQVGWHGEKGAPWSAMLANHPGLTVAALTGMLLLAISGVATHRTARDLRDRAARYRTMVAALSEGVVVQDAQGIVLEGNLRAEQILGLSHEQLVGQPVWTLRWTLAQEDGTPLLPEMFPAAQALRTGRPCCNSVIGLVHPDGRTQWLQLSAEPVYREPDAPPSLVVCAFLDITARRLADRHLRQLSQTVECCPMGVFVCDTQGRIEYVNPRMESLSGYARNDMLGQTPRLFKSGQTPVSVYAELWRDIHAGKVWRGELLNRHKGGSLYWEALTVAPVKDGGGRITHFIAIKEDISERRRIENALADQRLQFASGLALARMAPWEYDVATDRLTLNDHFYELYGTTAEHEGGYQITLETYAARFLPADSAVVVRDVLRAALDGPELTVPRQTSHKIARPDGALREIVARFRVLRDAAGKATRLLGVVQDITDRRDLEEALKQSETAARQQFNESDFILLRVDPATSGIIDANAAAVAFYGYPHDTLLKMALSTLGTLPEEKVAETLASLESTQSQHHEWRQRMADGSLREVQVSLRRVRAAGRDVINATVRDLSAWRQAEAALQERTFELSEVQARLDRASHAKTELIAMMSRDVRPSMSTVVSCAELLLSTELSDKQRLYLQSIRTAGEDLFSLVNDADDLALVESARLRIEPAPMDVRKISEDVLTLSRAIAEQKSLDLQYHCADTVPRLIQGDPRRLRQILDALVSHAVQVTDQGRVALIVNVDERVRGLELRCEVFDTSHGLVPELQRALSDSKPHEEGNHADAEITVKLGLILCQRLAQALGGKLEVESDGGRGCRFRFTMPTSVPSSEATDVGHELPAPAAITHSRPLSILVVDDFVTNRMVACEILRHLGHRCDMAADGAEAVVKAATQYYDAILMDLHMPKLGGIAAARQIRAAESGRGHRVPIVALTVEVDSKVHAECREAGMDGVLTKPFHIAEVEQVLASFPAGPA